MYSITILLRDDAQALHYMFVKNIFINKNRQLLTRLRSFSIKLEEYFICSPITLSMKLSWKIIEPF